jgi:hypothetical protein
MGFDPNVKLSGAACPRPLQRLVRRFFFVIRYKIKKRATGNKPEPLAVNVQRLVWN